ncbi:MAG: SDR family oxidoreductase [Rickettsiales bacterium TMED254]|nr:short-chain dehydrogenase [Rickettsiales bacterium]RPF76858.1 MAG: SDR family oxidoreductase [Rickettsiales bacterium TMED254]
MKKRKTVLITGASKRIGNAMAINLAKKGYNIAIHYNKSKRDAELLKSKVEKFGISSEIFRLNLQNISGLDIWFKKIVSFFNGVDILINNASVFEYDSLKLSSNESFDKHISINLKAPFFLSKFFVENLKNKGNIINIIDQRVLNITPYFTSYTISKSGLYTLTKSLALSLAPKVRVNAIGPGPTLRSERQSELQFRQQINRTPLKKQVNLDEINSAINFLISSDSVTGQIILLDSGQNMGWANTNSKKFIDD